MAVFRRRRARMTMAQAEMLDLDLKIGGTPMGLTEEEADTVLPEAWRLRRDVLLAESPAGRRPGTWWLYEAEETPPPTPEAEVERLAKLGELTDTEITVLFK